MVKAYLRYEQVRTFGVIASPEASPVYADDAGKLLVTAALERLSVWDIRRGLEVRSLDPPPRESGATPAITRIARAPGSSLVASGAADGSVRLWNLEDGTSDVLLKGHRSEVTALRFNTSGALLVSGGKDTNVVVWDVVAEAGLCRLRGHKDQVTDAVFVERPGAEEGSGTASAGARLVTCSKDATVRVWDLDTQHCAQTIAALGAECWSLDLDPRARRLAVGTNDDRLHLFAVTEGGDDDADAKPVVHADLFSGIKTQSMNAFDDPAACATVAASIADAASLLTPMGNICRADRSRVASVRFDAAGTTLGVQTVGRAVEVYRVRTEAERAKRLKRRRKRKREKERVERIDDVGGCEEGEGVLAADELHLASVIRTKAKTRGFAFAPMARRRPGVRSVVAVLLDNNALEEWELTTMNDHETGGVLDGNLVEPTKSRALEAAGHRADVRALALSPDDATLVTCSQKGLKVWDPTRGACLRSIEGGYGLCVAFAPGGRHVVVGTKSGALEIVDVQVGAALAGAPNAHTGAVWAIALLPDGAGFVSASADKTVKFWEWRLAHIRDDVDTAVTRRELGIAHIKTLQMAEDVLSVRVTADGKLLSVSLLDNTLKVFFADSLKFFLSLYGHRLPALCHDVSNDAQLLVSGGADKNLRVWGLDFGDCHRSIFAHNDSVTAVAFVPKTHYLFSAGKDRAVKYWDADKFEPLLSLSGHHAAVWCIAVSSRGSFTVTGGHDRAIRVWERTDEPFFVDEEREKRLESLLEEGDSANGGGEDDDDDRVAKAARDLAAAVGSIAPAGAEAGMAGRKTLETLSAADAIVDALDVAAHERRRIDTHLKVASRRANAAKTASAGDDDDQHPVDDERANDARKLRALFDGDDFEEGDWIAGASTNSISMFGSNRSYPRGLQPNPLLMGRSPERYALASIEKVKSAELERAILSLPFSSAFALLDHLGGWLESGERTELTCRLAALIIRLHYVQLGATTAARGILLKIRPALRQRAAEFRDIVGFNVAGIGAWEAHIKDGDFGGQIPMEDDEGNEDANTRILEAEDEVETGEMNQVGPGWG